jgi:hypothetical protein
LLNFIRQAWHGYKLGREFRNEGLKSVEKMIGVEAKGDIDTHRTRQAEVGDKDPTWAAKLSPPLSVEF